MHKNWHRCYGNNMKNKENSIKSYWFWDTYIYPDKYIDKAHVIHKKKYDTVAMVTIWKIRKIQ
jgi:hypothetical protein